MNNPEPTVADIPLPPSHAHAIELFRVSPMRQTLLSEILMLIRSTGAKRCLEIGVEGGAFSSCLRKRGGEWQTLLTSPAAVEYTRPLVSDGIGVLPAERLSFGDKEFDLVVLADVVEAVADVAALLKECHRVMQTDGYMAINVPYAGRMSPLRPLRRHLEKNKSAASGMVRREFRDTDLFELLKTGFDVIQTRSYARFFSELVRILLQSAITSIPADAAGGFERRLKLHRIANPFFRIAFQLDYLLYPLRGNQMVALARRHSWRPRNSPVLQKAESITGAMLSKVR